MELYHLGLTVHDLKASYRFYSEVVGLRPQNSGAAENADAEDPDEAALDLVKGDVDFFAVRSDAFDKLTNNPGCAIKFLYLQSEDEKFRLQLIEYVDGGADPASVGHNRGGSPHLSFFVPDVAKKRAQVEALGDVKITSDTIEVAPGMFTFYVEDPDGVPVEFLEVRK
ncbi:MAG TPA: VOC family protein [Nocardioides sp.]|nr:VOC family protein [Nocardioides sp.]